MTDPKPEERPPARRGKSQLFEDGKKESRNYDPFEDIRNKYQRPGTVITPADLPNRSPRLRELTEQEMKQMREKKFAKGGFVPFGKKGAANMKHDDEAEDKKLIRKEIAKSKGKPFAKGGQVSESVRERDTALLNKLKGDIATRKADREWVDPAPTPKSAPKAPRRPKVNMDEAMAKIEAHERRKRERDEAESAMSEGMYRKGGRVGYAEGGKVSARGMGAAVRGGKYCT